MNRILALVLCAVMMLGLVPAAEAAPHREPITLQSPDRCCSTLRTDISPMASRPGFSGKLIEITPQRVEDTFDYLNEVYIENYPEAALVMDVATEADRALISGLAETITAGCRTDKQKAEAIDRWLLQSSGNIVYEENASAYANDVYFDRIGNCLSYANLMQLMLRSLGIPAVVGDGWRGDMKTATVDLFYNVGHAWCFAYVGGEWVLYDPLWIEGGTTDREYIAEWIYLDQVEVATPAGDEDNLPPETYDRFKVYYTDGKWYMYSDGWPNGVGVFTSFINNQMFQFVGCQDEGDSSDGWDYVDGQSDDGMAMGEVYRNGWVSYGGYLPTYAHVNGMMIDGAVMEYQGTDLYMQGSEAWPIEADAADYAIQYGTITFRPGYSGAFLKPAWGNAYDWDTEDTYVTTWTSETPDIVSVDAQGRITCKAEGFATLRAQLTREEDGAFMSSKTITVQVANTDRVVTLPDHTHSYTTHTTPATCTSDGYITYSCSCGEHYTETIPALGHDWDGGTIVREPTVDAPGELVYTCVRCSTTRSEEIPPHVHDYRSTVTYPTCTEQGYTTHACTGCGHSYRDSYVEALGHAWAGLTCTLCGETRENPFSDVNPKHWYVDAVLWAVDEGITNGIGGGKFGTMDTCLRSEFVTFLWRVYDQPEPASSAIPFKDVKKNQWYTKPVLWAVEKGITNGSGNGMFGTEDNCLRSEIVTFLWRAAGSPKPTTTRIPFKDVKPNMWYTDAVLWAVENGITNGVSATEFGTEENCLRCDVVTFLYRVYGE